MRGRLHKGEVNVGKGNHTGREKPASAHLNTWGLTGGGKKKKTFVMPASVKKRVIGFKNSTKAKRIDMIKGPRGSLSSYMKRFSHYQKEGGTRYY